MSNVTESGSRPVEAERPQRTAPKGLAAVCAEFIEASKDGGLDFSGNQEAMVRSLIAALTTKPFVIFSGLSGSGKTRLATALGQWFGINRSLLQPVRPDWVSPEAVLGAPLTDNTANGKYAWFVPRVLEFILAAAAEPEAPYLLVLEEMNLSHVEQYFADVLSGMEGDHPIVPNLTFDSGVWRQLQSDMPYLPWPSNLFLVGTINVDETTYKFSPKVLDRATTIEFRVASNSLQRRQPKTERLVRASREAREMFLARSHGEDPRWDQADNFANALKQLHRLLFAYDAEFGHRVFQDCMRLAALLIDAGSKDVRDVLDECLLHRMLPKFEHANEDCSEVLEALAIFAFHGDLKAGREEPSAAVESAAAFPRSYDKIQRLRRTHRTAKK